MAIYGLRGPGHAHRQYKPHHVQELQYWKDKTSEAVMVLETNVDVMTALQRFYLGLKANQDFPSVLMEACQDDIDSCIANIEEIIEGFKMHTSRARLLAGIIGDRKELVRFESKLPSCNKTEMTGNRSCNTFKGKQPSEQSN